MSAAGQAPAVVWPHGRAGCALQVDRAVEYYAVHLDGDDRPVDPADLAAGAVPGTGGAFLSANSSAILTDAILESERGRATGISGIAGMSGSFMGLLLGGVLAPPVWLWCSWFRCRSACSARCRLT